jgi:hypothetical protein
MTTEPTAKSAIGRLFGEIERIYNDIAAYRVPGPTPPQPRTKTPATEQPEPVPQIVVTPMSFEEAIVAQHNATGQAPPNDKSDVLHWQSERTAYDMVTTEKAHMYECQFSFTNRRRDGLPYTCNRTVLVICACVEDAIAICRKQWWENFVLHQVIKRNSNREIIVDKSVIAAATKVPE